MTEWTDDLFVMITNLKNDATWDASNSAMYSKETYYYNHSEDDKGDFTGRVPVTATSSWRLLILNYNEDEARTVKVEYGAAIHTSVALATLAASVMLNFAF